MNTIIFDKPSTTDPNSFVRYWGRFYNDFNTEKYLRVIEKPVWEAADIRALIEWKNNMKEGLTVKKEVFVSKVVDRLTIVNELKQDFDEKVFVKQFKDIGKTWGLTLLHAIRPDRYPVYDQHVHRAYNFISGNEIKPSTGLKVYFFYFDTYVPFFNLFLKKITDYSAKETDNALWAFGKFLSSYKDLTT